MSDLSTRQIYFEFIYAFSPVLGLNPDEDFYKKKKGALIVDFLISFRKKFERERFLHVLKVTRDVIKTDVKVRKWVNNNIKRLCESNLSEIDKLTLLIEFEDFDSEPYFYKLYIEKLKSYIEHGDLQNVSNIYNFLWGFEKFNEKKNYPSIFKYKEKEEFVKKLSKFALSSADEIISVYKDKKNYKKIQNHTNKYVIGIGFIPPNLEATHLNLIYIVAKSIKKAIPDSQIYLAVTSEQVMDGIYTGVVYDQSFSDSLRNFWKDINVDSNSCYISSCSRLNDFENWLSEVSPDLFLSVGGVFRTEVFSRIVNPILKAPVVLIPASNSNKLTFPVSGVLARNQEFYTSMSQDKKAGKCFLLNPEYIPLLNNEKYEGESIKKNVDDRVISVILNSNRILNWFNSAELSKLMDFLGLIEEDDRLKLLLVGESSSLKGINEKLDYLIDQDRIIVLGTVKNLRGIYKEIDLVFTLPGITGGGGAVNAALYDGIPAICWYQNDACLNVPERYQYYDWDEFIDKIKMFISKSFTQEEYFMEYNSMRDSRDIDDWKKAISEWTS